jgi:hypothetical protein
MAFARTLVGKRKDESCCFQNTNTHWGRYGRPVWNQEAGATEGCEPNLGSATLAALAAPYRHPRLNGMKLAGDPTNPLRIREDATAGELRAEILKHLKVLVEGGTIDLEELLTLKRPTVN